MSDIKLTAAQKRKINTAVNSLNKVRAELQKDNPDYYINWYLEDCGNLNLLENNSHDLADTYGAANQEVVIETFDLDHSSGGGW